MSTWFILSALLAACSDKSASDAPPGEPPADTGAPDAPIDADGDGYDEVEDCDDADGSPSRVTPSLCRA